MSSPRCQVAGVRCPVPGVRCRARMIRIGDSLLLVSGEGPRAAMAAFLYVYVDEADGTFRRAVATGARGARRPSRHTVWGSSRHGGRSLRQRLADRDAAPGRMRLRGRPPGSRPRSLIRWGPWERASGREARRALAHDALLPTLVGVRDARLLYFGGRPRAAARAERPAVASLDHRGRVDRGRRSTGGGARSGRALLRRRRRRGRDRPRAPCNCARD